MKTDTKSLRSCKEIEIGLGNSYAKRVVGCIIDKFMNNMMTILQISFQWKQTETKICSSLNISLPMFIGYAPNQANSAIGLKEGFIEIEAHQTL